MSATRTRPRRAAPPPGPAEGTGPGEGGDPSVVPPVDPRFRQRRIDVRRQQGRRRLRVLVALLVVLAAVGAAYLLADSPLLDVDEVVVTGTTFTDPAAVVDATGVERGDPLVWVDVDAVDARVEALPWVAEARVSRDWRGRLRVGVTEQVPAAWVRGPDDEVVVVAGDGRVLGPAPAPFPDLVEIRGVRRVPPPGDRLSPDGVAGLASTLPPALVDDLVAVDVGGTGVTAVLGDGPELRLGSLDEIATKGAVAEAVLARLVERGIAADFVDVSVPSAPVAGTDAAGALPGLDAPAGEGGA